MYLSRQEVHSTHATTTILTASLLEQRLPMTDWTDILARTDWWKGD